MPDDISDSEAPADTAQQLQGLMAELAGLKAQLASMRAELVSEAVAVVKGGLRLSKGQGVTISGSGFDWTISADTAQQTPAAESLDGQGSDTEGEWYELELCDGTTLEAWVRNVTPP